MKRTPLLFVMLTIFLFALPSIIFSNNINTDEETLSKLEDRISLYYILDNRFEGKSDAFDDLFKKIVKYPEDAYMNCRMGLAKITFTVDKEGQMSEVKYSNPLGYGIEKALDEFFEQIKDNFKPGRNSNELEMTVGFRIKNGVVNYRPDADFVVTYKPAFRWNGDTTCGNTQGLYEKAAKYMKKKKFEKAAPFVEELSRRFPDDSTVQKYKSDMN